MLIVVITLRVMLIVVITLRVMLITRSVMATINPRRLHRFAGRFAK